MTILGYTVRLPDIEPLKGEDRPPQFTAIKGRIIPTITENSSKHFSRAFLKTNHHSLITFSTNFIVPSQKLSFPLHFPVDRHSLIFDPRRIKPSSHINCTLFGYVVRLPTKDPLLGVLRWPQSFAVDKKMWTISALDHTH